MAVDDHDGSADDVLFRYKAQKMGIEGVLLADGFHPVVVGRGAAFQSWHHQGLSFVVDGVAWQCLATADEHLVRVLWVLESHEVASVNRIAPYAPVAEGTALATHAQSVTPTIDEHAVALTEEGRKALSVDGIDGECQYSETEH